jgi:hypothetical protein
VTRRPWHPPTRELKPGVAQRVRFSSGGNSHHTDGLVGGYDVDFFGQLGKVDCRRDDQQAIEIGGLPSWRLVTATIFASGCRSRILMASSAVEPVAPGPILDQPVAGLLTDLKDRGLLADTLVAFVTEFGRMPTFQKNASGRNHNPSGFTVWLAGAGVKGAFHHGATDEFGYKAVEDVATIYDLYATILHQLGLNHTRLTFYNNGIERRLTDVHGHVIEPVLA